MTMRVFKEGNALWYSNYELLYLDCFLWL